MSFFVLFESPAGYALFEHSQSAEAEAVLEEMQEEDVGWDKFRKVVSLKNFAAFKCAEEALAAATEGGLNKGLKSFLDANLPKGAATKKDQKDKKSAFRLGLIDDSLGSAISNSMG